MIGTVLADGHNIDLRTPWDNTLGKFFSSSAGQPFAILMAVIGMLIVVAMIVAVVWRTIKGEPPAKLGGLISSLGRALEVLLGVALLEAPLWLGRVAISFMSVFITWVVTIGTRLFHLG